MDRQKRRGKVVDDWKDVPKFATEAEEAGYWARHSLGETLLDQMRPLSLSDEELGQARPRTRPVGVRFDEFTLGRLRALAERRHRGYQTLLKEFVVERLYEEEKREGLIAGGDVRNRRLASPGSTTKARREPRPQTPRVPAKAAARRPIGR